MNNFITKTTQNIKRLGFGLVYFFQIIMSVLFIFFREDSKTLIFSIILLDIVVLITIIVFNHLFKKAMKKYNITQKNDFLRIYQSIEVMSVIIPNFLKSLKSMGEILFEKREKEKFEFLDKVIDNFSLQSRKLSENYTRFIDKDLDTDALREILDNAEKLNELVFSLSIETNKNLLDFNEKLLEFKLSYNKMVTNNMKMLYEFGISTQILSNISTESSQFSTDTVRDIFNEFDKISEKSRESVRYTETTMDSFINDTSRESLSYISSETKFFINRFNEFYGIIQNLKTVSDNFMEKTLVSLNEIQKIASSIKDISEKIKLISINVRIEAAHLDSRKSGFQVLGNEINDFADLTSKIISNANNEIQKTINNISDIKDDYQSRMNEVIKFIPELQNTITPFETIINKSIVKIRGTITELYSVSNNISESLKFIIDKFQYQDITTQEGKNIILYINKLSDNFAKIISELNIGENLSEEEKRSINKSILDNFMLIITTQKEREIIETFADMLNVEVKDKKSEEESKSFQKVDDSVILF
ncbi:MAG TPA: methyl-accepting chemotaxis protein [Spirochaetota bacterium]|nr:methyl-accepting chemotaxis protein [Spirochaetota bacterium]